MYNTIQIKTVQDTQSFRQIPVASEKHSLTVCVAMEVGTDAALVLEHFLFFVETNRKKNVNFDDGKYWTYDSYKTLISQYLPYFNYDKLRRIIASLADNYYILKKQGTSDPTDTRNWYALTDKAYALFQNRLDEFKRYEEAGKILYDEVVKLHPKEAGEYQKGALLQNNVSVIETSTGKKLSFTTEDMNESFVVSINLDENLTKKDDRVSDIFVARICKTPETTDFATGGGKSAIGGGKSAMGGGKSAIGGGESAIGGGEIAIGPFYNYKDSSYNSSYYNSYISSYDLLTAESEKLLGRKLSDTELVLIKEIAQTGYSLDLFIIAWNDNLYRGDKFSIRYVKATLDDFKYNCIETKSDALNFLLNRKCKNMEEYLSRVISDEEKLVEAKYRNDDLQLKELRDDIEEMTLRFLLGKSETDRRCLCTFSNVPTFHTVIPYLTTGTLETYEKILCNSQSERHQDILKELEYRKYEKTASEERSIL